MTPVNLPYLYTDNFPLTGTDMPAWTALFPHHRPAYTLVFPWTETSGDTTLDRIRNLFKGILVNESRNRTFSLRTYEDMAKLQNEAEKAYADPAFCLEDCTEDGRTLDCDAEEVVIAALRERSYYTFTKLLFEIQYQNMAARYHRRPRSGFASVFKENNDLVKHAEYIFSQVRIETAKFDAWREKNTGKSGRFKPQPACPWNTALREVSILARDLFGEESVPDPLPFHDIMNILADAVSLRQMGGGRSGFMPMDILKNEDFKDAKEFVVPVLIRDLWVAEFTASIVSIDYNERKAMKDAICERLLRGGVSEACVSPDGHVKRGWLANLERQVVITKRQQGWLKFGVPRVCEHTGVLLSKSMPPTAVYEDFEWRMDIFMMRNQLFVDWEQEFNPGEDLPTWDHDLPSYQEATCPLKPLRDY